MFFYPEPRRASPPATSTPNRPHALSLNALNSCSPLDLNPTFEPSNPQTIPSVTSLLANLDAASSISPLFATLTENTGGWVSAIVNFFAAQTEFIPAKPGVCAFLRQSTSERSEAKDPQELKNLVVDPVTSNKSPVTASALFLPPVTSHQSQVTKSFTIRTSAKRPCNPCRIRTSKTQDLKPFRMNTYRKTGEGDPLPTASGHYLKPLPHLAHPYLCTCKKGPAAREPRYSPCAAF
jgi:hypothetical protein